MRKLMIALSAAALAAFAALPALAALPVGAKAPELVTVGAIGGKAFRLNLQRQLRKGPVVLYFFPKAFTKGCTLEARAFSQAREQFRKAGAQIIGLSADDLPTLQRFSVEACRSAFPVAAATPKIIAAYDVGLEGKPGMSNRTSYVIGRDGRVHFVHSDLDWSEHVSRTLAAVQRLKR